MISPGRILAVAGLRLKESLRGPLLPFLGLFLVLALAAGLATPGEGGLERQRAVDVFVLDAALLLGVLAAAALGAGGLSADRETGRAVLLEAGPLRPGELLAGGLLGRAAALALLFAGVLLLALLASGLFGGGPRAVTRIPLRSTSITTATGEQVTDRRVILTSGAREAVYHLPARREELGVALPRAWIQVKEYVDDLEGSIPPTYQVAVQVGEGPEQTLTNRVGNPIAFRLDPRHVRTEGGTPIRLRRVDSAYSLGLLPGGLVTQGARRPFALNVARALLIWWLACVLVSAGAGFLATFVGAPIATAGALLLVLVGRSVPLMEETALHAASSEDPLLSGFGRGLDLVASLLPDFTAYDRTLEVTTRWSVGPGVLVERLWPTILFSAILLFAGWVVLWARRRR